MDKISNRYGRGSRPVVETDMIPKNIIQPVCQAGYYYILTLAAIAMIAILICPSSAEPVPFNESIAGDRNLGQMFTFTMNNVSGTYAQSVYHYTVYDFKEIGNNYTYYSVNWGQWFKQDADPGKKYLAVWIRGRMAGTSYLGWGQDFFRLWVWGNKTIYPEPVHMQDIEIANTKRSGAYLIKTGCSDSVTVYEDLTKSDNFDRNHSGRRLPVVIQETENLKATFERGQLSRERYGWKDENEMDRMVPGETWDGYILYQIPSQVRPADVQVTGGFRNFGLAIWSLTQQEINQDSPERYIQAEQILADLERETGLRLPDSIADQRTQG